VGMVRGRLPRLTRRTLAALTTLDVHARDVTGRLRKDGVRRVSDFGWQAQMRYYHRGGGAEGGGGGGRKGSKEARGGSTGGGTGGKMGRKRSNVKGNAGGKAGGKAGGTGAETKAGGGGGLSSHSSSPHGGGGGGHFDPSTISFDECGSLLETRMVNASMKYGNEYLGNTSRLVITPLTDQCYRTC
jgi:hypothetical protein